MNRTVPEWLRITIEWVTAPPRVRLTPRSMAPEVTPVAANMTSPFAISSQVKQRFGSGWPIARTRSICSSVS